MTTSRAPQRPKEPAGHARVIAIRSGAAFEAWLDRHAGDRAGVWLKLAKKGSGIPSLTDGEAVDIGFAMGGSRARASRSTTCTTCRNTSPAGPSPQRNATVPPDPTAALATRPRARGACEALAKSLRYAVILKLITTRTPTARAAQSFRILVEPGFTECVLANGELEQRGRTATRGKIRSTSGWVVRGSSPWTWASAHGPAEEREYDINHHR